MALINRVPQSLLSVLDTKSQGKNPQTLAEFTQPVLELRDYYQLRDKITETVSISTVPAGTGAIAALTCPEGVVRYVHMCSCNVNCGAGESASFAIGVNNSSASGSAGTVSFILSDWETADVANPLTALRVAWIRAPFWMEPGDAIHIRKNQVSPGNMTYSLRICYNEYQI